MKHSSRRSAGSSASNSTERGGACGLERLDADGALLFVDRFAETAARWRTLLADYRPDASASAAPATAAPAAPDAAGAFLPV